MNRISGSTARWWHLLICLLLLAVAAPVHALSANANLSALTLSAGTLTPAFLPATLTYNAAVPNSVAFTTVTPTLQDLTATVKVNGTAVASGSAYGPINLNVGPNNIAVLVTAQNGVTTQTYTVTVTRAPSNDANLSNLKLSSGTLSPAFVVATLAYTASVAVTSITVTPTADDPLATVKVNGAVVASGNASAAIALVLGSNTVTTVVTAPDGSTTHTYTVTVTRTAPATNANLGGLALSAGTLSPAFASATTAYTASVANSAASITVTPTSADANATLAVDGTAVASGSASGAIALNAGSNTVTIVVTAQDGVTTKTYTVAVTRAPSSNAALGNLALSAGTLSPAFASAATSYTASVAFSVASVTVTPTTEDATATAKVDGGTVASGSASQPIALGVGGNTVTIAVTAGDGKTTTTYRVTVTRAAGVSSNANLSSLALSSGTLSPAFATATTAYTATASVGTNAITVTPIAADATATVRVDGAAVGLGRTSGPIPLNLGNNTVTILVTAGDGITTMAYTVAVTLPAGSPGWPYLNVAVPNVGGQPAILDMGATAAQSFLSGMLNILSAGLGAKVGFIGQSAAGTVMVGTANDMNIAFMPLFYDANVSLIDALYGRGTDQFNIVKGGKYVTVAPAIYNLGQFAALLDGAQANVDANGTISAAINGTTYVVHPSYQVQILAPTGSPYLSTGSDGNLHFTDASGLSQTLYPAFLEPDTLGQALYALIFVSSPMSETDLDGRIIVQVLGTEYFSLAPDIALGTVPAEHASDAWWQEGPNRYRIQNQLNPGTSQGFTLTYVSASGM